MSELLTEMTVTVMNDTAEGIRLLAKESQLSEGEVIDRLAIIISPKDREICFSDGPLQVASGIPVKWPVRHATT